MAKRRGLSADEIDLWRRAMRSTEPLPGRQLPPAPQAPQAARPSATPVSPVKSHHDPACPAPPTPQRQHEGRAPSRPQSHGLDAATARRARRGRLIVDRRIDLHGMRQDEAHNALVRFVLASGAQGCRCVLVITGKGGRADRDAGDAPFMGRKGQGLGVLKRMVPVWLSQEPLRSRVFTTETAHQRDGGAGALYVFLRRQHG